MTTINKVALAVIEDGKILMARSRKNKEVFYTLGGKVEGNETDVECLVREVTEEVGTNIDLATLTYLSTFTADAHDKPNTRVRVKLYYGQLIGVPSPSSEVEEIAYFDSSMSDVHHTNLSRLIFRFLKQEGYIV